MAYPQESTLPHYHVDVFSDMNPPRNGAAIQWTPENMQGLGDASLADFAGSPLLAGIKALRSGGMNGVGQVVPKPTTGQWAIFIGVLAVSGFLSYQAGKAMAPSGSDSKKEKIWGWVGIPVGLLTGVVGIGIMGAVSNYKERS